MTHQYVFDYREGEIYWCTADVGWVTGHSYIVYGPARERRDHADVRGRAHLSDELTVLAGRATSTRSPIFYTAPTAIRALMGGARAR